MFFWALRFLCVLTNHVKVLGWKAQLEVPKMLIFFIGVSYQAFYCGSFDVKKTKFWPLDLPLEFFKIFFLIYDPHFRRKKKCSDSPENSTNRPDDIKSGPNLVSDRFFDFLKNPVPGFRVLPTALFIPKPWNKVIYFFWAVEKSFYDPLIFLCACQTCIYTR